MLIIWTSLSFIPTFYVSGLWNVHAHNTLYFIDRIELKIFNKIKTLSKMYLVQLLAKTNEQWPVCLNTTDIQIGAEHGKNARIVTFIVSDAGAPAQHTQHTHCVCPPFGLHTHIRRVPFVSSYSNHIFTLNATRKRHFHTRFSKIAWFLGGDTPPKPTPLCVSSYSNFQVWW